jgi:glycosyltransferase involved in cell wall biosynthesis
VTAPATIAEEARRRRGWLAADELARCPDDGARRARLAEIRVVMATFRGAEAEAVAELAAVGLAQREGVPCVVVDRRGVGALVRHGATGYVSDVDDENHLRAAVAKLCRDDVLWSRFAAALRAP